MSKPVRIIIEKEEERVQMAGILVKNHYQVKMGKQFKKGSQKSYDYYLEIVDTLDRKEEVQKNECAGKA